MTNKMVRLRIDPAGSGGGFLLKIWNFGYMEPAPMLQQEHPTSMAAVQAAASFVHLTKEQQDYAIHQVAHGETYTQDCSLLA